MTSPRKQVRFDVPEDTVTTPPPSYSQHHHQFAPWTLPNGFHNTPTYPGTSTNPVSHSVVHNPPPIIVVPPLPVPHWSQPPFAAPVAAPIAYPLVIHRALCADQSWKPPFKWDVTQDPKSCLGNTSLVESATNVRMRSLIVRVAGGFYPYNIHVDARKLAFVSVGDVLCAISLNLRTHVSLAEYNDQKAGRLEWVEANANKRMAKSSQEPRQILRLDFLGDCTTFLGLTIEQTGPTGTVLLLHLSRRA